MPEMEEVLRLEMHNDKCPRDGTGQLTKDDKGTQVATETGRGEKAMTGKSEEREIMTRTGIGGKKLQLGQVKEKMLEQLKHDKSYTWER